MIISSYHSCSVHPADRCCDMGLQRQQFQNFVKVKCSVDRNIADRVCRKIENQCCTCCWEGRLNYALFENCESYNRPDPLSWCKMIEKDCCLRDQKKRQ